MGLVRNVFALNSGEEGSVFSAQHIFVHGVCVSCHCGLQSTVVQSRVRQLQVLDPQRNCFGLWHQICLCGTLHN